MVGTRFRGNFATGDTSSRTQVLVGGGSAVTGDDITIETDLLRRGVSEWSEELQGDVLDEEEEEGVPEIKQQMRIREV